MTSYFAETSKRHEAFGFVSVACAGLLRVLTAEGGSKGLQDIYKGLAVTRWRPNTLPLRAAEFDPIGLEILVELASDGNAEAHAVLGGFAEDLISEGSPLPPQISDYTTNNPSPPLRGRGRPASNNIARDMVIVRAVDYLTHFFGYPTYRNRARKGDSACSIVAEHLSLNGYAISEEAIEKIVEKSRKL